MKATALRIDAIHECYFERPAFGLVRGMPDFLRIFYDRISPRYPISADQISATSADVLSDISLKFELFQGSVSIELKAESLIFIACRINNKEGISIIKDVLTLTYDALREALPDTKIGTAHFTLNTWFEVEGGAEAASLVLARSATPETPLELGQAPADAQPTYLLRANIKSEKEDWQVTIKGEPSVLPDTQLFVSFGYQFGPETKHDMLADQIRIVEEMSGRIVNALGLATPDSAP